MQTRPINRSLSVYILVQKLQQQVPKSLVWFNCLDDQASMVVYTSTTRLYFNTINVSMSKYCLIRNIEKHKELRVQLVK